MDREDVGWRGYFAAAPTPFTRDGHLDDDLLAEVLTGFAGDGAHGVLVNGSTGEWYAQTAGERERVCEAAVKAVGGRVPVLAGVSSMREDETVALARHAIGAGADGVLYSPPPAARMTQAEVVAYYERTAARVPGPVMVYNIPADVSTNIEPETFRRLAAIPNVVGAKDSTPDDLQYHRTVGAVGGRLRVFGNALTPAALSMMATGYGGDGHFGAGLPLGPRTARAFDHLWAGELPEAFAIAEEFTAVRDALHGPDGNGLFGGAQAQLKTMMRLQGRPAGYPRPPRLAVEDDPAALDGLRDLLARLGLTTG
ncbi:MAG TPA: dihydrodipicolinate synthase family protein [Streptosporangiaceae bacterium]|jgi:4-hydroxy-tetrahydrodipicolinate synthase